MRKIRHGRRLRSCERSRPSVRSAPRMRAGRPCAPACAEAPAVRKVRPARSIGNGRKLPLPARDPARPAREKLPPCARSSRQTIRRAGEKHGRRADRGKDPVCPEDPAGESAGEQEDPARAEGPSAREIRHGEDSVPRRRSRTWKRSVLR